MDAQLRQQLVSTLWSDVPPVGVSALPLMAHYTSMEALEKILTSNQIWFSHPLLMNDHEEVSWGIRNGLIAIEQNETLQAVLDDKFPAFSASVRLEVEKYGEEHLFNTCIFCVSEHSEGDNDGRLSMWRGYGGNGTGAAIVFDANRLNFSVNDSPLMIGKVTYAGQSQRSAWIGNFVNHIQAQLTRHASSMSECDLAEYAGIVFDRLKFAAIFYKHNGFREEAEWRVVYMPERDTKKKMAAFYGYANGAKGLEPKLKLPIMPIVDVTADDMSLEKIVNRIILGPSRASGLVLGSALRMLDELHHGDLKTRLRVSTIPYRSSV